MRLAGASTFAAFKPTFKRSNLYSITVQYGDKIVPGSKLPKDNRYLINTEYMKLYEWLGYNPEDLEFDAASGLPVDGSNWKTYDLLYCDRVTTED
jgi:hypothetical protein